MSTFFDTNNQRVTDAITAGERLGVGVTLSYVGGGSDKFWSAVWVGDRIVINYGRHGTRGAFGNNHGLTDREGATKMWQLLRSKVGKGYTVVDASVLTLPPNIQQTAQEARIIWFWDALRDARAANPKRPLDHPELLGTSPRTPTQGSQVLLDLTSPTATTESLLACAVADPTERFLPPMVMSRPDLPYQVKFMAALSGNATGIVV